MALHFAVAIGVLIVYACLHPFTGWRDPGLPLLDFLTAPWPRYYSQTDLIVNVLGFMPFSFALVPALGGRLRPGGAVCMAVVIAGLLSLGLETLQNFLPSRVPSNVDLGCNALGGLIGALAGARWGAPLFDTRGALARWRTRRIVAGHVGEAGMVLMGLWLLTLLTPESLLFATGDLRRLFDLPTPIPFNPQRFVKVEAGDFVNMGKVQASTQLNFFLMADAVNGGKNAYSTNHRNADGLVHAVAFTMPGTPYLLIAFEDLFGGGDKDYNDIVFTLDIGRANVDHLSSPEPSTGLILGGALVAIAWARRPRRRA